MSWIKGNTSAGRPGINLTETEIRYAMENTKSASAAARFLRVSYESFRKYASMYIDEETGKSLFELIKNPTAKGIKKASTPKFHGRYGILDILKGKWPEYPAKKLKARILRHGLMEECCDNCGFNERRITDYTVPLILDWKDGDLTNHKRENLRFLCYNCFYLIVGNLHYTYFKNTSGAKTNINTENEQEND